MDKSVQLMRFEPPVRPVSPVPLRTVPVMVTDSAPSLHQFLQIAGRHKLFLALFVLGAFTASIVLCLVMDPLYEATAQVEVDRRAATSGLNQADAQTTMISDMDQIVTTQMELIQSDPVLRPVVEKYNLLSVENQLKGRFGTALSPAGLKAKIEGPIELKKLKVKRPPNSYTLNINYRATSPRLAAAVANGIARSYIDYVGHLRAEDGAELKATLMRQKGELETRIDDSDRRIAALTAQLNILDPEQKSTLLTNRLNQLSIEHTNALADLSRKSAESEVVNSGSVAAAQSSPQADALNRLIEKRNEYMQRMADVKTTYGENYPEYQRVSNLVKESNRQIEELRSNIGQRSRSSYQQAVSHEKTIKSALDNASAEFDHLTTRMVAYQRLKEQSEDDKKRYSDLVQRIRDEDLNIGFQKGAAHLANPARPPSEVAFPKTHIVLPAALLLSILMGFGAVVLTDSIETRVSGAEAAARRMNVNVMAKLPVIKRQIPVAKLAQTGFGGDEKASKSVRWFYENVRTLMNTLAFTIDPEQTRTLLFTSCAPGEGKSTISAHLALASASIRRRTLLIDADMRRGSLHRMFQIPLGDGLSRVLAGEMTWREAVVEVPGQPNLNVLPAGRWSPAAFEQISASLPGIIADAAREYDLVLIDAPPLAFAESVQLSTIVDGVIMVAHAGKTSAFAASNLIARMQNLNVEIIGMVLNQSRQGSYGGYYNSYYGYGDGHRNGTKAVEAVKA